MSRTTRSGFLALGVSFTALIAGAAQAQDPGSAALAGTAPPAAAAVSNEVGTGQGGDIIVTAQRRSERLRDVPISVTALSAEALSKAGVTNTVDLGRVTPGVEMRFYGSFLLPSIRGISSNGSGVGDSSNVAIYIDGVYQAQEQSQLADLPDVQSVQVLKGPQGTLYGQNAAGGAIIIDTIKPSFKWKGKVSASYGNYNDKNIGGYVTGPITSTLAFALSANYHDHGGYNRDLLRGGHDKGLRSDQFRGKLMWQPSADTSFTVAAYKVKRYDTGPYAGQPLNGNSIGKLYATLPCDFGGYGAHSASPTPACPVLPALPPFPSKPHQYAHNIQPDMQIDGWGVNLVGKIGIGDLGAINTITSYKHSRIVNFADVDQTPINTGDFYFHIDEHDFIQEVNFVSNKMGGLSFIVGGFYMNKVEKYVPQLFNARFSFAPGTRPAVYPTLPAPFPYGPSNDTAENHKKSYAAYGEVAYDFTDQFTLTAGGRYSWETQDVFNTPVGSGYHLGDPLPALLPDPRGTHRFSAFTWHASLRYKPDNNNTFYASFSKGFKSGYVNNSNINACGSVNNPYPGCIDAPVTPEKVDAYEIGYKGRLSDRLSVNVAAFHSIYKSIQVFVYNPQAGSTYKNAASGNIWGGEAEVNFRATPEITLHGGASYIHGRYSSFPNATIYIPNPCTFNGATGNCGNTQTSANVKGNELMRTPTWTANVSANWDHKMSAGDLGLYVDASYNSGVYFDPLNRAHQKAYVLLDSELSFAPSAVPGLRVVLWGKNLTNKAYLQSVLESALADASSYGEPRTFGVRAEFQF
jgi:iron complex outermembrane receptor protein